MAELILLLLCLIWEIVEAFVLVYGWCRLTERLFPSSPIGALVFTTFWVACAFFMPRLSDRLVQQ